MKIAIIGPVYPYRGGIATFSDRLAHELLQEGNQVDLYTFYFQYPGFLFPGTSQVADYPPMFNLNTKRVIHSMNPFNWWKVGRQLRREKYDVVLVAYSIPFLALSLGTIARVLKKNTRTKIISLIHNLIPHEKRIGDNSLSGFFVNSMHAHIALSKAVLEDIKKKDALHPAYYVPHPAYDIYGSAMDKHAACEQLQLDPSKKYVLFFGLIRAYKGLDLLIKAMSIVASEHKEIHLLIAGEFYEDETIYRKLIEQSGIIPSVIIRNQFIPDEQVAAYFSASDIVVQPYKHATQSGVTQICYHFNKPMIVTNVGGLPEIVPDNKVGFVAEPDETAIARAILSFYNENKEAEFVQNILIEKQKYSWKNLADTITTIAPSL